MEQKIQDSCKELRDECKAIEGRIRVLMTHSTFDGEQAFAGQHDEMKAHVMLGVRAIETVRMQLGKVCQYAGDGVSIFDKM